MSNKPTILLVLNSKGYTGAFKAILNTANVLNHEFDFQFVAPKDSKIIPQLVSFGYKVHQLPFLEINKRPVQLSIYLIKLLLNAFKLFNIAKETKAVRVHGNDFYNLTVALLPRFGYDGAISSHVRFLPSVFPKPLIKVWFKAFEPKGELVAVSKAVYDQIPNRNQKTLIFDRLMHWPDPNPTLPENQSLKLLYIANFTPGKGQDHALRIIKQCLDSGLDIKLTMVGGTMGLKKNKRFKNQLAQKYSDLIESGKVVLIPFSSDLDEIYRSHHVFLNFSEAESFSFTCLEASAFGLPVISFRSGGPEEIIADGKTGFLVGKSDGQWDTEAAIGFIKRFHDDRYLIKKMGFEGPTHVRNTFNPSISELRLSAFFKQMHYII
jgi:glycosyltransferase involved in cell wall biosynthesis